MRPRTKNRLRALQVAYSSLLSDKDIDNALTEYFAARESISAGKFAGDLLTTMNENLERVDEILKSRLDNWSPERLAILDRLMMRLAVTEFLFFDEIPPKVTINEYLQLAHWFGTEDSPRFINGVLDAVLKGMPANSKKLTDYPEPFRESRLRFAIISDIHSNLSALEQVLKRIDSLNVDSVVCLGDTVGYGADPEQCVSLVRQRCKWSVLGNHDSAAVIPRNADNFNSIALEAIDWTRKSLSKESLEYLGGLELTACESSFEAVHATPDQPERWRYLYPGASATAIGQFDFFRSDILFIGHTHLPLIFRLSEDGISDQEPKDFELKAGSRYIVNVGSVGQPRDNDIRAAFAIYDDSRRSVEFQRASYDNELAASRIIDSGLPAVLASRLLEGR